MFSKQVLLKTAEGNEFKATRSCQIKKIFKINSQFRYGRKTFLLHRFRNTEIAEQLEKIIDEVND